jgi:4-carboxymuconolactone decarboxylase
MSGLNIREQALVALGAAIASNCIPCVEYHIPKARNAGCSDDQILHAARIADKVRRVPARMVLDTALARIEECRQELAEAVDHGCGCAEPEACGDARAASAEPDRRRVG